MIDIEKELRKLYKTEVDRMLIERILEVYDPGYIKRKEEKRKLNKMLKEILHG